MFNFKHEWIETNVGLLLVLTMLAISIGGLVRLRRCFSSKIRWKKWMGCARIRRSNCVAGIFTSVKAVTCAIRK
jgi:hypothetical protein